MDTKKILYRLLKGKTPIDFTSNTLVYEVVVNNKPMNIVIYWHRSTTKSQFTLITPNRKNMCSSICVDFHTGDYLNYELIIDGHTYYVELDDVELDEVNLLVSKVMKEFQEKMFEDIGKAFFEPDPVYGDLLSDEKQ